METLPSDSDSPMEPPTVLPGTCDVIERRRLLGMWEVMPRRRRRRTEAAGISYRTEFEGPDGAAADAAGDGEAEAETAVAAHGTASAEPAEEMDEEEAALAAMLPKITPWCVDGFPWPAVPLARWPSDISHRSWCDSDGLDDVDEGARAAGEPEVAAGFAPPDRLARWSSITSSKPEVDADSAPPDRLARWSSATSSEPEVAADSAPPDRLARWSSITSSEPEVDSGSAPPDRLARWSSATSSEASLGGVLPALVRSGSTGSSKGKGKGKLERTMSTGSSKSSGKGKLERTMSTGSSKSSGKGKLERTISTGSSKSSGKGKHLGKLSEGKGEKSDGDDDDEECEACETPRRKERTVAKIGIEANEFEAESARAAAHVVDNEGLDVVFVIDITGSMASQIAGVKQMICQYCEQYGETALSGGVRIHIITYTERSTQGFTSHYTSMDAENLVKYVRLLQHSHPPSHPSVTNAGGGDGEENLLHALAAMYHEPGDRVRLPLDRRILCFIITDAPPHNKKQNTGEANCEREVLRELGMANDDGSIDMYSVLDRVLDQREGRIIFVPIMYRVQPDALHFYAQAALLTQGMLLRANSKDSGQLAAGLATVVTMMRQLLAGAEIDIPDSLGGFEALRIDALVEAASEEDERVPPPETAGDVHAALASLLDSVREIGTRKWGARQAVEKDSSEDEGDCANQGGTERSEAEPKDTEAKEWIVGDAGLLCRAAVRDAAEECSQQQPAMNVTCSIARVQGVDHSLGGEARPTVCIELRGLSSGEARRPADIVLAIDVSYSMHDVMPQVKETMHQVYSTLLETDRLAIVTFSRSASEVLPLTLKSGITDWVGIVAGIKAQTATNIEDALRMSLGMLTAETGDDISRDKCLVFLSDGMPNVGRRKAGRLCRLAKRLARGQAVTIHALGFTEEHDITLMSALPRSGSGSQGGYYYLGCSEDIPASVGDCLGGLQPKACQDITIDTQLPPDGPATDTCLWYGPSVDEPGEGAPLLELRPGCSRAESLLVDERQVRLLVLPAGATKVTLLLSWRMQGTLHKAAVSVDVPDTCVELPSGSIGSDFNILHLVGHVLRLQVASALAVLAGGAADIGDRYDDLHGAVLKGLASVETTSAANEEDVVFLEGMLQSLERDLGEALADRRGAASAEERGVLLSFAQEHFTMHSASSLSRTRATYASKEQVRLRLSFLQSSAAQTGVDVALKSEVSLEDPDLTDQELGCRRECEEHMCFVTLSGWRECVLGLGLFTHPRTLRERRKNLPPEVDLVVDYVSAEAYNLGIRTNVKHAEAEGPADDEDEDESDVRTAAAPRADILTSSARKRINAWLPLYINESNWRTAGTFAPSAFSLIATQLNAAFKPSDALKVCARLLCCVVVGFVHPDKDSKKDRAKASEAAVQMYCDVHRLFHKMAETYPEIRTTALEEVLAFLYEPDKRTRKGTPDLGNLIAYLSILDEVTWTQLAPVFVPEMVRRACTRLKQPLDPMRYSTTEELIARFDELEPDHGLVILFNKVFNSEVARPAQPWDAAAGANEDVYDSTSVLPCASVCQMYDRRWGQLPQTKKAKVISELGRIKGLQSVAHVFRELLPFGFSDEDACELILWANQNADNKKAIHTVPNLKSMPRNLSDNWKRVALLRREMEGEVRSVLDAVLNKGLQASAGLIEILEKAKALEVKLSTPAEKPKYRFSSKEEACAVAAAQRESAAKAKARAAGMEELFSRSAVGYKGKPVVKGAGKGKGKPSPTPSPSEWWECREQADLLISHPNAFDLRIVIGDYKVDGVPDSICVSNLTLGDTGADLKKRIAEVTGLDTPLMRLVHRDGILNNSMTLSKYKLHEDGSELRLDRKRRGGKKPGHGWYKAPPNKVPFEPAIAGRVVHDLVFSRMEQYVTCVQDGSRVDTLLALVRILNQHAVVVCISDSSRAALRRGLLSAGAVESDEPHCLSIGEVRLVLAAEIKQSTAQPRATKSIEFSFNRSRQVYEAVDPESAGVVEAGASDPRSVDDNPSPDLGNATGANVITTYCADIPESASEARVVFVYGSLQESATLAQVMWRIRPAEQVRVFHLVGNIISILVETEEDRRGVDATLTPEGQLREELVLRDQRAPPNAVLISKPDDGALPCVLDFQLKMAAMGFVVRLRQRFGCCIPEVFFGALQDFLKATSPDKRGGL